MDSHHDQQSSPPLLTWIPQPGPLLVFHSWYNVPIVSHALYNLYKWVREVFPAPIGKWVCFLEPQEHETVIWDCYALPNCDVQVIPAHLYDYYACQFISWYVQQVTYPGTLVLIAKDGDYTPLWQHRYNGWKIVVVHPPPGLCYTLETLCHYYVQMPVSWGQTTEDVNTVLVEQPKAVPSKKSDDEEHFEPMETPPSPMRHPGSLYELDPSILTPAAATADTVVLPLDEFLERVLPSSLIERNVLGIIEEMEKTLRRPAKPFNETGPEDVWPRLQGDPEEEKEEKEEEKPESCWSPEPVVKTLADVCKAAASKPLPPRPSPVVKKVVKVDEPPEPLANSTGLIHQKAGKQKAVKYAQQCPLMAGKDHSLHKCHYWHPKKTCDYFPTCYLGAERCGYGHPFCKTAGMCSCDPKKRDPQKNHRLIL